MAAAGDDPGPVRWSPAQLADVERAEELEVAVRRADGTLARWTPVWAVVVGEEVFVRTWQRRATGWYGGALRTGVARIRVPGVEAEVRVEPVGSAGAAAVDSAYAKKYGPSGARSMVAGEAVASTLRLVPTAV